jgi:hypothetical protein
MNALVMIIAPGTDMDRKWWPCGHTAVQFVEPMEPVNWIVDLLDPLCDSPPIRRATFQRYIHPSWRVVLSFFVDTRLGARLPIGYVMPGWVHGVELEQTHLCEVCRRPANTPTQRLCFRHMLEFLEGIGQ